MTQTIWLSFADETTGKNRGAAVVAIDDADLAAAQADIAIRFPHALPGADVIAAAVVKARATGCNPGGHVAATVLPPDTYHGPLHRLMQVPELIERGLIDAADATPKRRRRRR